MISSPYNFVPLNDEVFRPDWGEISHDCPFSDAVSGELEIRLTAKTPIYIRGSHPKPTNVVDLLGGNAPMGDPSFRNWVTFYKSDPEARFSIPGTSLKGVIRNVLKIAGFGSINEADDDFMSVRDLHGEKYTSKITHPRPDRSFEACVKGGWLMEERCPLTGQLQWVIIPCEIARVEQEDLERFDGRELVALGRRMSAKQKYEMWRISSHSETINFDTDGPKIHRHSQPLYYAKAGNLGAGNTSGTLVLTGQSGNRDAGAGKSAKHMEFIFFDDSTKPLVVPPLVKKKFLDTHPHDLETWKYWRENVLANTQKRPEERRVPVFWIKRTDSQGADEEIESFGLSQMFRLPARSIHEGIPKSHKDPVGLDIAERLFGTLKDDKALRGRISFGGLACQQEADAVQCADFVRTVLGSPQPTFHPAYLEQSTYSLPSGRLEGGKQNFKTWLSPEVRIRGWKRYHVAADAGAGNLEKLRHVHNIPVVRKVPSYKVATAFRPLKAGAAFVGKIRFHNLRRVELGALIWSLTWGGNSDLRHSIGMGKSLGMGVCQLEILSEQVIWHGLTEGVSQDALSLSACQNEFESSMCAWLKNWAESDEMKELKALADPQYAAELTAHQQFPPLKPGEVDVPMDFATIKKSGFVLPRLSEILEGRLAERITGIATAVFQGATPPPGLAMHLFQDYYGEIVAGDNGRLRFKPDEAPQEEGRFMGDANVGERWLAKLDFHSVRGNLFKGRSKSDAPEV